MNEKPWIRPGSADEGAGGGIVRLAAAGLAAARSALTQHGANYQARPSTAHDRVAAAAFAARDLPGGTRGLARRDL